MMKRTPSRMPPDDTSQQHQNAPQIQQPGASNMHTLAQSAQPSILGSGPMLSVGGFNRSPRPPAPPVISYLKPPAVAYAAANKPQPSHRVKPTLAPLAVVPLGRQSPPAPPPPCSPAPAQQFQRLKVEDALSYLDQVKYKFNTQPQVYNDFLDIMKEFKSQTIDTPGVITRVSNLFQGHPELIVGFNTFLPPGYKIEVKSNGQVSVSMPSPTGMGGTSSGMLLGVHHQQQQQQLVHMLPVPTPVNSSIVHNLSSAPTNTLHQISQAHQQIEAAAIHHTPGNPAPAVGHAPPTPGQPVEFNHAIEYVNKIKSRFSRQPDKYKRFLEILHAYQRGHRDLKEPQAKQQTEQEVYSQVAKLFENQEDLLTEFGQFLPDAKAVTKPAEDNAHYAVAAPPLAQAPRPESPERFPPAPPQHAPPIQKHSITTTSNVSAPAAQHHHLKRSPSFGSSTQLAIGAPAPKKARTSWLTGTTIRDVSYADAAKLATVADFSFFERARRALRHAHVYDNFMRCLLLFTNEIISGSELVSLTAPFLCRHPELHKWLQQFVAPASPPHNAPDHGYNCTFPSEPAFTRRSRSRERYTRYEPVGPRHERTDPAAMDIVIQSGPPADLSACKRLGTSYCALPRDAAARKCSGRTPLCKEVLNDTWVSIPTWSEDSTFVTSRKTQYEEYIYRCEDERFELDVVIETNASTIRVLEGVQKKLSRMSAEDAAKYRLDECLGGHSPTIHQRALKRIYGDKAVDIIAGLKKNPVVAVPVVLRRLKAKEEEWREAQKGFNKQWREQNEKYYLKSLDHQGINFKQNDLKAMRSKSLFNELESAYAARRPGPHLIVDYDVRTRQEAIKIVRDTAELLIHHARRQTAIQKTEKRRIKRLLRQFLPDLLNHPRQPLSDDEREMEEKEDIPSPSSPSTEVSPDNDKSSTGVKLEIKQESSESDNASDKSGKTSKNNKENKPKNNNNDSKDLTNTAPNSVKRSSSNEDQLSIKSELKSESNEPEDDYRDYPPNEARFVCTSSWYLFLRVHAALCQRLAGARRAAAAVAAESRHCAATALRLLPSNLPGDVSSPSEYYGALLELVKGVLDGNVESSAYEDAAREMLGIKAYPAYTLDKLVSIAVRQLQHIASEPWSVRAAELASRHMRGTAAYIRRAARQLRHHHAAFLVRAYGGDECKVTFELLEGGGEGRTSPNHNNDNATMSPTNQRGTTNGEAAARLAAWSLYTERLTRPLPGAGVSRRARSKPVFLVRNARGRCGGYTHNATHAPPHAPPAPPRRRKPPRLVDSEEATATSNLRCRLLAFRPLQLYQGGALAAARASHARLHAARRDKFRAWLRERRNHH